MYLPFISLQHFYRYITNALHFYNIHSSWKQSEDISIPCSFSFVYETHTFLLMLQFYICQHFWRSEKKYSACRSNWNNLQTALLWTRAAAGSWSKMCFCMWLKYEIQTSAQFYPQTFPNKWVSSLSFLSLLCSRRGPSSPDVKVFLQTVQPVSEFRTGISAVPASQTSREGHLWLPAPSQHSFPCTEKQRKELNTSTFTFTSKVHRKRYSYFCSGDTCCL